MTTPTPLALGRYPTPIERMASLSGGACDLWVKHDDRTHEVYGGNKVRKLEWLLAAAQRRGDRRVVTIGAAGSHHVLATTVFGTRLGFEVTAVLLPQPRTDHAVEVLRAGLGLGLHAVPTTSRVRAVAAMLGLRGAGTYTVPVGGSSVLGSTGYVTAARELAAQVRAGEMPEPDVCVVALGSGGTAAGLAVGFAAEGMETEVVGVCVAEPLWAARVWTLRLVRGCARPIALAGRKPRLRFDERFLGPGYGKSTVAGDEAARAAENVGLTLDPTYTAKAFACALWHVHARRKRTILYWHTLSAAPLAPLLRHAPPEADLGADLRALLG